MAYFKHNEPEETRRNDVIPPDQTVDPDYGPEPGQDYFPQYESYVPDEYDGYEAYDDGLDEPEEDDPEEDISEEERQEQKKDRIQMLFGAGDLTGIIAGTVVILLLLAFLFQMINFVRDDIHEFFETIGRFFM